MLTETEAEDLLGQVASIQERLDDHIKEVFEQYLEAAEETMSNLDGWSASEPGFITFYGTDGAFGCYEMKVLEVPIRVFQEPDLELDKVREQTEEHRRLEKERRRKEDEAELKRLEKRLHEHSSLSKYGDKV